MNWGAKTRGRGVEAARSLVQQQCASCAAARDKQQEKQRQRSRPVKSSGVSKERQSRGRDLAWSFCWGQLGVWPCLLAYLLWLGCSNLAAPRQSTRHVGRITQLKPPPERSKPAVPCSCKTQVSKSAPFPCERLIALLHMLPQPIETHVAGAWLRVPWLDRPTAH